MATTGNARELRAQRAAMLQEASNLVETAEAAVRDLSPNEKRKYDRLLAESDELLREIEAREVGGHLDLYGSYHQPPGGLKMGEQERAACHYIRTGDRDGLFDTRIAAKNGDFHMEIELPREYRANDTTMNVTTDADGKYGVPVGLGRTVAARRNAIRLSTKLGCQNIPGKGTTVNHVIEAADPNELATTSEQADNHANNYERDAPTLGSKAFTLVKKTKKIELTEEILDDEDVGLMNYLAEHMGRAIGLTHNTMLLTEVAANGTALKTFASATVIAVDELEAIVYNDTLGYYLDDAGSVAWVMRPSVMGEITLLDDSSTRRYNQFNLGPRSLLEYPVHYSNASGATQASAKSVYFGNWYFCGIREEPALRLIRDIYSTDGLVILKYSFRACYGVLQAGAIGYGVHPSA